MRRRPLIIIGLEAYAVLLACLQLAVGMRTDEAKYALNIPYPHPPLVRSLLSATRMFPLNELLWRIAFATVLIQSVWFLLAIFADRTAFEKRTIAFAWLLSAGVMAQAGTIMMAPLTAVSELILIICIIRPRLPHTPIYACFIGLLWLASLFTAYQALLLAPLAYAALGAPGVSRLERWLYFIVPIVLLVLYSLSNPLALASMMMVSNGAHLGIIQRALLFVYLWLAGGSIVFSIIGIYGIWKLPKPVIVSFLLVCVYTFLSPQGYYAIIFLPFFCVGIVVTLPSIIVAVKHLRTRVRFQILTAMFVFPALVSIAVLVSQLKEKNVARSTIDILSATVPDMFSHSASRRMIIVGSYGHEWQYYSPIPVYRFNDALKGTESDVLVCLRFCPRLLKRDMYQITLTPVETYVRR